MKKIIFPTYNGVVVHCDDKKVISVTNCYGRKQLKSFKEKNKIIFWHFPFMRGIQFFFCGIWGLVQAILLSYDLCGLPFKSKGDINKYYIKKLIVAGVVAVFAVLFAGLVWGYVPGKLGWLLVGYDKSAMLRNVVILLFKLFFFYVLLLLLRGFAVISEFFRFNRAADLILLGQDKVFYDEKKKLSKNREKSIKNKENNDKIAEKLNNKANYQPPLACGFLNFLIFVFILDFCVVTLWGASYGFWFNLLLNIAVFLACMSVGFEILNVLDNCKWKWLRYIIWPTACLVQAKPTTTHIETALVAVTEINLLCNQKGREFMEDESKKAFSIVYTEVRNKLASAGVNDKSDADWLIATILGKNRAEIKLVASVTDKQYQDIMKATERRANGESLDNIFGFTEFYGIKFDVNKKVLTPRMETELLVENVLKNVKNFKNAKVLDVGTGSGAIAIAVAKNCDAQVTAIDISKMALATAENNAKKNGVDIEFIHSNLFDNLKRKRKFDIIVSNPPYIPTKDIEKLDKNVRDCDPTLALDGGEDGLDFYHLIVKQATSRLTAGGVLLFEVGKGQAGDVKKIMKDNGFEEIKVIKDYNKIERIVCGKFR